jgi:hypothetical protein
MTTLQEVAAPAPMARQSERRDRRGSPIPSFGMIRTRLKELRKRRGLMIALVLVNIGIPTIFLIVRLLAHAFAPKSYGAAGGYDIYTNLCAGVMYIFGFIVAAALGCTAGSIDLTEGMFRHLVVTGRSRLALYLARIPAGLAIIGSIVGVGFAIVCFVCVFAAPTAISYQGLNVPAQLSRTGFEQWASQHADEVICDLPSDQPISVNLPCGGPGPGPGGGVIVKGGPGAQQNPGPAPTKAMLEAQAVAVANENYRAYSQIFLYPSNGFMIRTGLWILLEATIGFLVGLGLGSLLGQRTVAVILMIVLEIVLTPLFGREAIKHLINFQRAIVGVSMAHVEPAGLPVFGGGGNGPLGVPQLVPEARVTAIIVIVAWLVVWTALGAWRMMTRDA